ncbi:MAG: acetylxylan esterase [Thermoguttaceae bacterium]|nr:acetylxylan esterase [Thermoguttaceae bacterium]
MRKIFPFTFVFQFLLATVLLAANYSFYGETDKNPLEYQPGEEMTFKIQALLDGKPVDGVKFTWRRTGDDGITESGETVSNASEPFLIKTSLKVPGFVYVFCQAIGEDGKPLKREPEPQYCKNVEFYGGAGVLMDEIKSAPEPEGFDAYWDGQKARLEEVPVEALEMVPVESGDPNVLCWDVKIRCIGKPASGYLCMPKDAKEKSLPAEVSFHGYGCNSANKPVGFGRRGIALNINIHGILNGQPQEYYTSLFQGELRGFGFNKEENQKTETSYLNGIILRALRAVQFVKTLPEWDGKNLKVTGGSGGAFQSLSVAGLDHDVTECYANVAWCLDLSGPTKMNRLTGWRPEWTEALEFLDPANHAKRIQCPVTMDAGLGDYVCPPSGQVVVFNNLSVPKKLTFHQGNTHGYGMPNGKAYTMEGGK